VWLRLKSLVKEFKGCGIMKGGGSHLRNKGQISLDTSQQGSQRGAILSSFCLSVCQERGSSAD